MNDEEGRSNQEQQILLEQKKIAAPTGGVNEGLNDQIEAKELPFQIKNQAFDQLNDSQDDFKDHIKSLIRAIFADKNGFQTVQLAPEVFYSFHNINLQSSQDTNLFDF